MNILVLDAGTSSMRGILYDEKGTIIKKRNVEYSPVFGKDGEVVQDAQDFINALNSIVSGMEHSDIDAVCITAQRSSIMALDKQGRVMWPVIMWQDRRNRQIVEDLKEYNGIIKDLSGADVNTVFSGGKISWLLKEKSADCEEIGKIVNIPEFLIHYMTEEYETDYTYASRSNLMNIRECVWDDRLLEIFKVDRKYLCRLNAPGSLAGCIRERFSKAAHIKEKIPVITAGGDQQCAALGQGAVCEGVISLILGTGAFLTAMLEQVPDECPFIVNASAVPGKYIIEADSLTCAAAFNWYLNTFYADGDEAADYEKITKKLEEHYGGKKAPLVLPFFQGRGAPYMNTAASGTITGIDLSCTKEDILLGLLEGILLEVRQNIEQFRKYTQIRTVYISGGMSAAPFICQLSADILGVEIKRLEETESTARGALISALCTMGIYESMPQAFKALTRDAEVVTFTPDREKTAVYKERLQEFEDLYHRLYEQ